ncbi:hypothetical protein D3C80_1669770 [compost metagenome]
MLAVELRAGIDAEYVLLQVAGVEVQALAEQVAAAYQLGVVFQAGQGTPVMRQHAAEMAFAGAPVEPVAGGLVELQAAGEGLDLLPFAPRHIDREARRQ